MKTENMKIVKQKYIAPNIYEIKLRGNLVNEMKEPGQFVHLRIENALDPTLRRPISICDIDQENETLTMIYRVEGKGTEKLKDKLPGSTVNVLGPLGNGFPIEGIKEGDTCLLVGGGVGIPPLYYLAKTLVNQGAKVITILGFRKKEDIFYEKEFGEIGDVYITTEDGSRGRKGFVTDAMEAITDQYKTFYSCGPRPMLRAVQLKATTPGYISLEERMGCGVGACLACVCDVDPSYDNKRGRDYRKVCSDGPVFKTGEVIV
ncbi:dihydroorotate dehydrogenase electron transfer subunit [Bacillus shivajii]|uniref:dihydroorotate dehydrogenase electron transfer subunit n=1 Tax=Bacillus shivajii TaxID=1983719 RepID=UPI001CFB01D7|nr:dihydroorotate dehydrogenase electron transfer subunit [Bacillus shivajii]UCZ51797.1 dihydroorotate dehydrogenase electron transfer subunit [Bacillus shivajii]